MNWKDKQIGWRQSRDNLFDKSNLVKVDDNYKFINNYIIYTVKVIDYQFIFTDVKGNILTLVQNNTYIFDLEHPSNLNHKLIISRDVSKGEINNLSSNGTPGTPGSHILFYVGKNRPSTLYYYCKEKMGMGGHISILNIHNK